MRSFYAVTKGDMVTTDNKQRTKITAVPCGRALAAPAVRGLFAIILSLSFVHAADLPGEELTDERIYNSRLRRGDADAAVLDTAVRSAAVSADRTWLETAMDTWHAPSLSVQQAADMTMIPFGKGGVFIPSFSEANAEPDIEIFNMNNTSVASGETGRTYALEPGEYQVMLGSGAVRQRIVRRIRIEEGRTLPLIPDWSGLIIDVVDEQGIALKGEYELVRIDEFDPYGRGTGASIELGETVRTWVLKPGIYKILGVGEGYNTLTNFVTVRLMPGELTSFLLIQDPDNNFRIRGGGTVHLTPTTRITSNWRFGANVGVNVQLNIETDHQAEADNIVSNTFSLGALLDSWVLYRKKPVEWSTRLRFDQGINITENKVDNMINNPDRMLVSSIFIWRVLNWFGPYARAELNTRLFDNRIRRGNSGRHFAFVDSDYFFDEAAGIDSTSEVFAIEPAFSPLIVELGAGINADFSTRRYFEARARLGFGSTVSRYDDRYRVIDDSRVIYNTADSLEHRILVANGIILYPDKYVDIIEVGPQLAFGAMVRIGAFASAEGEVKIFAPTVPEMRIDKPDIEFNGTLSWRLSRILNLDYTYRHSLKQPAELEVPVQTSSHGIWLRLHYSSR